jgi:hypothetical protein
MGGGGTFVEAFFSVLEIFLPRTHYTTLEPSTTHSTTHILRCGPHHVQKRELRLRRTTPKETGAGGVVPLGAGAPRVAEASRRPAPHAGVWRGHHARLQALHRARERIEEYRARPGAIMLVRLGGRNLGLGQLEEEDPFGPGALGRATGQWLASAPGPGTGRDFEDAARSGEHWPCRRLCRRRLGRRRCLRRRKCCLHYGGQLWRRCWRRRWRGRRLQGDSVSQLGRGRQPRGGKRPRSSGAEGPRGRRARRGRALLLRRVHERAPASGNVGRLACGHVTARQCASLVRRGPCVRATPDGHVDRGEVGAGGQ